MKKVSILIPNRFALEMIELCIESIRKYTSYPDYKIVVYDDYSYTYSEESKSYVPTSDIAYLRDCRDKGWIELHENPGPNGLTHGGSLNKLFNDICDTDIAILLDNDTQITGPNWMKDIVHVLESDPKIICVADLHDGGFTWRCYRTSMHLLWFSAFNMKAYRDGMQVNNWRFSKTDRRDWPYSEEFKDYYPPENCKWTGYYNSTPSIKKDIFNVNEVSNDAFSHFYIKVKYDNPKGYRVVPVPAHLRDKYHHYGHLSMISIPSPGEEPRHAQQREERYTRVRTELRRLRSGR